MTKARQAHWFIFVTFLIALALDILPLPGWVIWLRPAWTLLILIYWLMALPTVVSVGWAFILGLLLDLLNGTLLGEHAFAMVIVAYIILKLYQLIRVYPMLQQTLMVFAVLLLYQMILFAIQGLVASLPQSWLYWMSVVVGTMLWPWIYVLLRDWRRKLNVV